MVSKVLTPQSWAESIKGSTVKGNDLHKALAAYESLVKSKGKPAERIKAIDTINKLAGELKNQVAALPKAKKYIADVAGAVKLEKLEIAKASATSTIEVTILNDSQYDDIYVSVEDQNLAPGRPRMILEKERLNKKASLSLTLAADGDGEGQIRWIAELTSTQSSRREDTVKDIKDGQTIKVRG